MSRDEYRTVLKFSKAVLFISLAIAPSLCWNCKRELERKAHVKKGNRGETRVEELLRLKSGRFFPRRDVNVSSSKDDETLT
jgi:hypothetical protein